VVVPPCDHLDTSMRGAGSGERISRGALDVARSLTVIEIRR
jgi:hypothetical protein